MKQQITEEFTKKGSSKIELIESTKLEISLFKYITSIINTFHEIEFKTQELKNKLNWMDNFSEQEIRAELEIYGKDFKEVDDLLKHISNKYPKN